MAFTYSHRYSIEPRSQEWHLWRDTASEPKSHSKGMDPRAHGKLARIIGQSASETGATVHAYPRPGSSPRTWAAPATIARSLRRATSGGR
jgi:hypothetical protein